MTSRQNSVSSIDRLMPYLVVALPLAGVVVYVLNQNGFFNTAPQTAVSTSQQESLQQTQPPAIVTLDDPAGLPQTVPAGEIVPFSFTVKNSSTISAIYPYKVSVLWNNGEQDVVDVNSISLAGDASTDISKSLKFETASATAKVSIEIEQPKQTITFVLPRAQ